MIGAFQHSFQMHLKCPIGRNQESSSLISKSLANKVLALKLKRRILGRMVRF